MTDPVNTPQDSKSNNKWLDVWYQFRKHKGAMVGAFIFSQLFLPFFSDPRFGHMNQMRSIFVNATKAQALPILLERINWDETHLRA